MKPLNSREVRPGTQITGLDRRTFEVDAETLTV